MGDTISSLVFRPPRPTPIHPSDYFYLDVDVHTPLCTNRAHGRNNKHRKGDGNGNGNGNNCGTGNGNGDYCLISGGGGGGGGGGAMCLESSESDLVMLDANFIGNMGGGGCYTGEACSRMNSSLDNDDDVAGDPDVVPNVRNGQVYKVPAFFIRRRNATQTILFSHGNAEDLGMMYSRMKDMALVLGVNVLAYDYTGYGLSMPGPAYRDHIVNGPAGGVGVGVYQNGNDGVGSGFNGIGGGGGSNEGPSENMIYRNIEAAYRYLTRVRNIPPHKIILYGRSLGSGPACYLAAKTSLSGDPVGGLILHSPFLSVYKVVADLNGLDLGMVGDLFHNDKRARNIRCPTLVVHGREDEVVPFWHAPRLLAAIPPEYRARPYYVDNMGHNHIESRCRGRYIKVVSNFLSMTGARNNDGGAVPVVPPHERALPCDTEEENPTFYLNQTWIRHARFMLGEVFADVGCYVNNTVDTRANGSRSTHSDGASSRRSKVAATSATRRPTTVESDARDDEEEFAPWRNENPPRRRKQQEQWAKPSRYHNSTESILVTRPNGSNSANILASSRTIPNYQKSQSMPPILTPSGVRKALSPSENESQDQQRRIKSIKLEGLSRSNRY
ncbi:hypothetical protein ACHAXA_007127 [Cyclostephanos tholiformis]|uniref:AB hydrolase-1 domain-containing protein n=1 Tax=Cyclostephanos tholiformis TaxID=382380 RepID=A0ABD3RUY4_9STRA